MKRNFSDRICDVCGRTFTPTSPNARTCSERCATELNRRKCRDRYREIQLMTPYVIPEQTDSTAVSSDSTPVTNSSSHPPSKEPDGRTPEPVSPAEESEQQASVRRTMALPPSQRYQFSKLWSAFQRRFAVRLEKSRLSDENFYRDVSAGSVCADHRSLSALWDDR